jgi:hypothetical protein
MVILEPSDAVNELPERQQAGAWKLTATEAVMLLCLFGTLGLGMFGQPFMDLSHEAVVQLKPQSVAASNPVTTPSGREVSQALR